MTLSAISIFSALFNSSLLSFKAVHGYINRSLSLLNFEISLFLDIPMLPGGVSGFCNKSKIICAELKESSRWKSHYIDVVLRQERERLCFIKRNDKVFLSDNRVVLEEKVGIFRVLPFLIKKVVDFLSNSPSFHVILPCFYFVPPTLHFLPAYFRFVLPSFLDNLPVSWPTSPLPYRTSLLSWECNTFFSLAHFVCFSATRIGASTRTRARTSRTQRVLNSCFHPSPLII